MASTTTPATPAVTVTTPDPAKALEAAKKAAREGYTTTVKAAKLARENKIAAAYAQLKAGEITAATVLKIVKSARITYTETAASAKVTRETAIADAYGAFTAAQA